MSEAAQHSFFYWNNPFTLKHPTMNVIELLLILGSLMALAHAWHYYKQKGDLSNLCIWFASVVWVFSVEPFVYFPDIFDIGHMFQVIFIHNEFSAGLIYNRTPLYIVALYPATVYTSYAIIQKLGIFDKPKGIIIGAMCVGFLNHCVYEIFDHYGPQYGWWLWDYDLAIATAKLASVPLNSIVGFALMGSFSFILLSRWLIVNYLQQDKWNWPSLILRTLAVGLFTTHFSMIFCLNLVYTSLAQNPDYFYVTLYYYSLIFLMGTGTLYTFLKLEHAPTTANHLDGKTNDLPFYFLIVYLLTFAGLWVYALPEYLSAVNGITDRGTPIGSLAYAVLCAIFVAYAMRASYQHKRGQAK